MLAWDTGIPVSAAILILGCHGDHVADILGALHQLSEAEQRGTFVGDLSGHLDESDVVFSSRDSLEEMGYGDIQLVQKVFLKFSGLNCGA